MLVGDQPGLELPGTQAMDAETLLVGDVDIALGIDRNIVEELRVLTGITSNHFTRLEISDNQRLQVGDIEPVAVKSESLGGIETLDPVQVAYLARRIHHGDKAIAVFRIRGAIDIGYQQSIMFTVVDNRLRCGKACRLPKQLRRGRRCRYENGHDQEQKSTLQHAASNR